MRVSTSNLIFRAACWLLLLAFATLCLMEAAAAQHVRMPFRATGAELVKRLGNVDPRDFLSGTTAERAQAARHEDAKNSYFVQGYIQAVLDTTEGRDWCWAPVETNPDEIWDRVRYGLQRMNDEQLRRDAADLIVEIARNRWPCATSRR